VGTLGTGLDHAARDLVAEDERKGAHGHQRGRRAGVVSEQVKIAAADSAGADRDAPPRRARQLGLGQIDQRRREVAVSHVELDGSHAWQRTR
jgi:hypothetical protein